MGPEPAAGGSRPRIGLVLGAGGVLGAAWMTGALPALQGLLPGPVNDVDLIVGTSAGSVLAAALRCGAGIDDLVAFQRGEAAGVLQDSGVVDVAAGPWPPAPHWGVGSPRLMLATLLTPHRVQPWVGASAWLPPGRARHTGVHAMVHALHSQAHQRGTSSGLPSSGLPSPGLPSSGLLSPGPPDWVERRTWIVAVDYDTGRRVIFGRDGAPRARLADAVVASCSIPGWYEPAVISGRRYVDGGVRSPTSLGVLARAGVDEVYVLAPMASVVTGRPRRPYERLERQLRRLITLALLREAQALRADGISVTVLTPGPEDLAVMGVNLMDPRRRELVLETSLRTSAALVRPAADEPQVA
jgi:NTE family protein